MNTLKVKNSNNEWVDIPGLVGAPGVGVPTGGNSGQILAKSSSADYDTEWINAPTSGGGSGSDGETIEDIYNELDHRSKTNYRTLKPNSNIDWFIDGENLPIQEAIVDCPAKQSGTGSASPNNPRNFIPYNKMSMQIYGRNLLDINQIVSGNPYVTVEKYNNQLTVRNNGTTTYPNVFNGVVLKIPAIDTVYLQFQCSSVSCTRPGAIKLEYSVDGENFFESGNWVDGIYSRYGKKSIQGNIYVRPKFSLSYREFVTFYDPEILIVPQDLDEYVTYTPYKEVQDYNFDLSQAPEPLYDGTINLTNGSIVINRKKVTIDGVNNYGVQMESGNKIELNLDLQSLSLSNLIRLSCNIFSSVSDNFYYSRNDNKFYILQAGWSQVASNLEEFNTYCQNNPIELLIPCSNLTPHKITTERQFVTNYKENTIMSSSGKITFTYATNGMASLTDFKVSNETIKIIQYDSTRKMWIAKGIEGAVAACSEGVKGFEIYDIDYDNTIQKYYVFPGQLYGRFVLGMPVFIKYTIPIYDEDQNQLGEREDIFTLISATSIYDTEYDITRYTLKFINISDNGTILPLVFKTTTEMVDQFGDYPTILLNEENLTI